MFTGLFASLGGGVGNIVGAIIGEAVSDGIAMLFSAYSVPLTGVWLFIARFGHVIGAALGTMVGTIAGALVDSIPLIGEAIGKVANAIVGRSEKNQQRTKRSGFRARQKGRRIRWWRGERKTR